MSVPVALGVLLSVVLQLLPADCGPVVSIQTPNASAKIHQGGTMSITWTASGIAKPVWKFFINDSGGKFLKQISPTATEGKTGWSASWSVPSDFATGSYELVVKDDSTAASDKAAFSIQKK